MNLNSEQIKRILALIYDNGDPMLFHGADWTDRMGGADETRKVLKEVIQCTEDDHKDCTIAGILIRMLQGTQ